MPIHKSMGHCCRKIKPFQGAPATFIENALRAYPGWLIRVHYNQVCEISFPDIPPFGYAETGGYGMAHLFHPLFQADPAGCAIMQHQQKGMLYQRKSAMRLLVRAFLFPGRMGVGVRASHARPALP